MVDSAHLQNILNRVETGKHLSKQDLKTLVAAVRSRQVTLATGDRAVAIGGSVNDAVIVTGDRNIVITGANAEDIRELTGTRTRPERLLLKVVREEVVLRLKQSLHSKDLIPLRIEARPKTVKSLWDSDIKIGSKPVAYIPKSWNILRVFDESQGKLLILGNPGVGKTTKTLELAKALCDRAENSIDSPIPVLFNLSNWKRSKKTILKWLIDELESKYRVRNDVAEKWIQPFSAW